MPGSPSRRVTRRRYWQHRIRTEPNPREQLALAGEYFRAMAAAGERAAPRATAQMVAQVTAYLVEKADELGRRIPATELEKGGAR